MGLGGQDEISPPPSPRAPAFALDALLILEIRSQALQARRNSSVHLHILKGCFNHGDIAEGEGRLELLFCSLQGKAQQQFQDLLRPPGDETA